MQHVFEILYYFFFANVQGRLAQMEHCLLQNVLLSYSHMFKIIFMFIPLLRFQKLDADYALL